MFSYCFMSAVTNLDNLPHAFGQFTQGPKTLNILNLHSILIN
jgi:hypothetical protein